MRPSGLPSDGRTAFDVLPHDHGRIAAADVLRVTLSLLGAGFATLARSPEVGDLL